MQESIHLHQKLKFNLRIYLYSLLVLQFFFLSMQYLGLMGNKVGLFKAVCGNGVIRSFACETGQSRGWLMTSK